MRLDGASQRNACIALIGCENRQTEVHILSYGQSVGEIGSFVAHRSYSPRAFQPGYYKALFYKGLQMIVC